MTEINQLFRGETKTVLVPAIIETVEDMRDYWPLTVRQLYYQLVSKLVIKNNLASYGRVSQPNLAIKIRLCYRFRLMERSARVE